MADLWEIAGVSKINERFKIDRNLQSLKTATLPVLKKIFIQYRFFTHYYIHDLSILIGKLPFRNLKTILAEILSEELGDGQSRHAHPNLYDDFLRSLGLNETDPNKPEDYCIENLKAIQTSLLKNSWAYGIGLRGMGGECLCQVYLSTMHHYFSQNPVIIALKDQIAWTFWDIHIGEVDLHHQEIVRNAIDELVRADPRIQNDLINGYLESINAWQGYWDKIFKAAQGEIQYEPC